MRYNFQRKNNEEEADSNLEDFEGNRDVFVGQENAFIRFISQIDEIPDEIKKEFLMRYWRWIMFSGKQKALAFINNPKTILLNSYQRMDMSMEEDANLIDLANETLCNNFDMMTVTRGTGGNLQNAMITQKREFRDTSNRSQNKKFWGGFLKKKEPEQLPGEEIQE